MHDYAGEVLSLWSLLLLQAVLAATRKHMHHSLYLGKTSVKRKPGSDQNDMEAWEIARVSASVHG